MEKKPMEEEQHTLVGKPYILYKGKFPIHSPAHSQMWTGLVKRSC